MTRHPDKELDKNLENQIAYFAIHAPHLVIVHKMSLYHIVDRLYTRNLIPLHGLLKIKV